MIYSLTGELTYWEAGLAVVECGGVGYACRTTMNTLAKIRELDEVTLYTHLHVTENSFDLFGFADNAELSAFRQLNVPYASVRIGSRSESGAVCFERHNAEQTCALRSVR